MTTFSTNRLNKLGLKGMLEHLTTLYYGEDREAYQQKLVSSRRQLHYAFPGLTIVLAEVSDHDYAPAMTHVLAPEMPDTEHQIGWHDTRMAQLSLDDGLTTLSEVESLEVKQEDGSWLSGTVAAGGPASQSYILTTGTGESRTIIFGDRVRKVVFRGGER